MSNAKVWLITGAGRGLGVDIVNAALKSGHKVIATGRDRTKIAATFGQHERLLPLTLDVTKPAEAEKAVQAAVAEFGQIDVLVNNAGNFYAGFFEELTEQQIRSQVETLLFGPMNVTRAVLPTMRKQRNGLVITVSSVAGFAGGVFCSAYAAAKFGVEGWMESLAPEVAPFGIKTLVIEPGFFRTELLSTTSTTFAAPTIADYAEQTKETIAAWSSMDGKQGGDPAKLADAIVTLAGIEDIPFRFLAGADAVEAMKAKASTLASQADALFSLSTSLGHE